MDWRCWLYCGTNATSNAAILAAVFVRDDISLRLRLGLLYSRRHISNIPMSGSG